MMLTRAPIRVSKLLTEIGLPNLQARYLWLDRRRLIGK